jgi:hypothetical protein
LNDESERLPAHLPWAAGLELISQFGGRCR